MPAQADFLETLGFAREGLGDAIVAHPSLLGPGLSKQLAALRAAGVLPAELGDTLARHPQLAGMGSDAQARALCPRPSRR